MITEKHPPETEQPLKFYTIFLNNKEMGTIRVNDIETYINKLFPGVPYTVNEEKYTIHITATLVQMLEIREHRIKAHIIND